VQIYTPVRQQLRLLGICLLFVVGSGWLVWDDPRGGNAFFGYIGLVFAIPALVVLTLRALRRQPVLVLDQQGFVDQSTAVAAGRVGWHEVAHVQITAVSGQRFLSVTPVNPEAVLARRGAVSRGAGQASANMGFGVINIPENVLPFGLEHLIDQMRRAYPGLNVYRGQP
jgi:hypothetical protein